MQRQAHGKLIASTRDEHTEQAQADGRVPDRQGRVPPG